MRPIQASAVATAVAITAFILITAFNAGRADGAAARLRGNCDATEIHHLKPGFYTEVKQ